MHTAELNVHVVVCACVGVTHFVWVCCYKNESYIHENRLKMASSQLNLNFILILKDALECITLHIGYKQIQRKSCFQASSSHPSSLDSGIAAWVHV